MLNELKAYKKTVSIVNETAIGIYENLGKEKVGFLLESYDKNNGRFTFMGVDPQEIIQSEKRSLKITDRNGNSKVLAGDPRTLLKEYYNSFKISTQNQEPAFTGGLVGSIGYDYIRYTEKLPDNNPDDIGVETIQMMFATEILVMDHVAETLTAIVLDTDDETGRCRAVNTADQLLLQAMKKRKTEKAVEGAKEKKNQNEDGRIIAKSDTLEQYAEKVKKIKAYIREGHIFQTVLSQRWTIETKQDGFTLYQKLRKQNPSPYLYYFNFGEFEIIGSSPEMIVKETDGKVSTCPIAGSRPRGKDEKEDEALVRELLQDEKEKAEHVMLVDLARNDCGKIAEFGSVKVSRFMDVQKYSQIMHISSLVEGKKKEGMHPFDLLSSFLPAGTLSGAPKIRAMEIIDELEETRRGMYGGATGYIDFNGNMDFCITIRTMVKKKNKVYLQAGAGIVADSVPETEYMECCNKVRALANTLVTQNNL